MERADQVFSKWRIDAGLAADGGINLREQSRRRLDEADTAAQARRGEAREVADDAAAQGHDQIAALDSLRQQAVANAGEFRIALRGFARRHRDDPAAQAGRFQARLHPFAVESGHGLVGDDAGGPRPEVAGFEADLVEQAAADADVVVAALVERNVDTQGL